MSAVERSDAYLIVKHGLYYKPKSQGYIGIRDLAGRFSLDEVATLLPNQDSPNQDGMTFVHADDAPEFSDACWDDVKARWLMQQRDEARAALQDEKEHANVGYGWLSFAKDNLGFSGGILEALSAHQARRAGE